MSEVVKHGVLVIEGVVGQPYRAVAGAPKAVTDAVTPYRCSRAVGREAVELDDQPSFRPEKVGLIALDRDAGHGPREPMPLDQLQEPILELRARPLTRANARHPERHAGPGCF